MVQFNLALREINCKVVYFGPGLSGKTTNLEVVHQKAPDESRGVLSSIATESDRTLFFDFMPLHLGTVGGMKTKFQLYTVPGQVYYNSTRKLVLRGADGVVFVADSNPEKMAENVESLQNLEDCLREQGRSLCEMPHVIQFNKRDLPNALTLDEMNRTLNRFNVPTFEAVAAKGTGVVETFKGLSMLVLQKVKMLADEKPAAKAAVSAPATAGAPRPAMAPPTPRVHAAPTAPAPAHGHGTAGTAATGPVASARSVATVEMPRAQTHPDPASAGATGGMPVPAVPRPATRPGAKRTASPASQSTSRQRVIISSSRPRRSVSPALVWGGAVLLGAAVAVAVLFFFRK